MPGRIILPSRRRNKFNAKPVTVDGVLFRSGKEAKRHSQLKLLEKAGKIRELEVYPVFWLSAAGNGTRAGGRVGKYIADFSYVNAIDEAFVVEDVKGGDATKTPLYRWKKKHLELEYGIIIQEV